MVELDDERDPVRVLARHRAQHAERRGDGVAAALDRELDDVLGVEVDRVLGERRARRVLDALVDGQDRDVAGAAEAAVGEDALERAQHGHGPVAVAVTTRSTKSGPGQVQALLRDRGALVAEEVFRLLAEDRFDAVDAACGARDGHASQGTFAAAHGVKPSRLDLRGQRVRGVRHGRNRRIGELLPRQAVRPRGQEADGRLVLYDSKDLVTHAVCVGMTGSGKTGLCLALLEEAALDGIPAIVIDPKGDLAEPAADLPGAARRRTSARGSTRTTPRKAGRRARRLRRSSRPSSGRRASPTGARTARASSGCATRPTSRSTRPAATPACRSRSSSSFAAPPPSRARRREAARASGSAPPRPACWRCSASTPIRSRAASTSCSRSILEHRLGARARTSTSPR